MIEIENNSNKIAEVMKRTDDILATAKLGLADLLSHDRSRRLTGLQNALVFGRSVTLVLQNLSSAATGFEEWYAPEQAAMKADPAMRYLVEVRNEILKQGKLRVSTSVHIHHMSGNLSQFGHQPPGAKNFFIGDQLGGSGWEIELPGGEIVKYYVSIPAETASITQVFSDLPVQKFPELEGVSVDEMVNAYVEKLSALVDRAKSRFIETHVEQNPIRKKGTHLRLVKND